MPLKLISDAPASSQTNLLHFERYIDPLVSILTYEYAETPFTIGIFGTWGSGKSTLLQMLDERLCVEFPSKFVRVHFNPWVHRNEPNMLIPLLHTLHDTLMEDSKERFIESGKRIGAVLLRLAADQVLKKVTAGAVSLEKLDKLEKEYLAAEGRVRSEIRRLRKLLQGEADTINNAGAKIVFFIDDLDRCEPTEIIDLLEAVKLFFDLKHVFIILAVDKEVIDRGIEVRYGKFKFGKQRRMYLGAEYIEKMVQLPLQLLPLHKTQIRAFINACSPHESVLEYLDLLEKVLLPNPRKIKRVLNTLTMSEVIAGQKAQLKPGNARLFVRLAVLQVQAGDLYAEVVRLPALLTALDGLYAKPATISTGNSATFKQFGNSRDAVQKLCVKYEHPESFLTPLFRDSGFAGLDPEQLELCLSMLGA